jgi:hypothetical protein
MKNVGKSMVLHYETREKRKSTVDKVIGYPKKLGEMVSL